MKIVVENCRDNTRTALRKIGYAPQRMDENTKEVSAVRALARGGFPRFHIYARMESSTLFLNLHLDQKRPSYAGARSHSGEHESQAVEKEAGRIKETLR